MARAEPHGQGRSVKQSPRKFTNDQSDLFGLVYLRYVDLGGVLPIIFVCYDSLISLDPVKKYARG